MALLIMVAFLPISTAFFPCRDHADLLGLPGVHVVWVIIQKLDDLKEVAGLPSDYVLPGHHGSASGIARQGLRMMSL